MKPEMMRAWVIDHFGGPEVYRYTHLPIPRPGENEVLVRVDAAGMNPVDWKIREGKFPPAAPKEFPTAVLRDFAGAVSALGPNVTDLKVGDPIYGITENGSSAEYTVAAANAVAKRPNSLTAEESAVVPLACQTAWQALFDHGDLRAGERVLIHAASGGVGTFAVQLAKWKGAYVIGTASEHNFDALYALGADRLIDHKKQRFDDILQGLDLVIHSIGQEEVPASLKVLKPGGCLVTISAEPDMDEVKRQGKHAVRFLMQSSREDLDHISALIDEGALHPVIDKIVPFDDAAQGMKELQEGHVFGKIGLAVGDSVARGAELRDRWRVDLR